jgi:hypothetical protein
VTVFFPTGVPTIGKEVWEFVVTIAAPAAATTTELNAGTTVQIQMAIRPGFGMEADTSKIDDLRLGAFITYQSFGRTTRSVVTAHLIDRPQDTTGAAARKHIETMADGTSGFLVNRRGLGSAPENYVAWASTQKYWVLPVICGPQTPLGIPDDGGQFELMQDFIVTGALVAGAVA